MRRGAVLAVGLKVSEGGEGVRRKRCRPFLGGVGAGSLEERESVGLNRL